MLKQKEQEDSYQFNQGILEGKHDDLSKVDENIKLMHNHSRPNSSYSINRQGADNRRGMFENLQLGKISKDLSDISNLEQDRWDEIGDVESYNGRKQSIFQRNLQNLEVKVPSTKKVVESLIKQSYNKKDSEDNISINSYQNPAISQKLFEQKYGYNQEDHHPEFEKDRSDSQQEYSQLGIKNNGNNLNSPSLNYIDTPNGRSAAKSRRQTHIALKMRGVQNIIGKSPQLDAISVQSPINQAKKLSKILQNQILGQSLPTSANYSHFNYKEIENNQATVQLEDKTILNQEEETHSEQPKKQHLIILTYMKRFINQLLKRLSYNKFELLSEQQFEMIGDSSFPSQFYRKSIKHFEDPETKSMNLLSKRRYYYEQSVLGFKKSSKNICSALLLQFKQNSSLHQFINMLPIIDPQSIFIILWESLLLLIIIFYLIFIPLKTCFQFNVDSDSKVMLIAYQIPSLIFTIDIGIGFQTGYYELGRVVHKRKLIALRYLKNKFLTDFISTFLMYMNSFIQNSSVLEIIILVMRISQMKNKFQMINDHLRIQNKYPTAYEMVKIAGFILMMSHMWGCLFLIVGSTSDGNAYQNSTKGSGMADLNWIEDQGLQDANWYTKYIFSVYFSIITMVTVGFGDIHPINIYEKMFVIGMTIISCGVFAYCVNSIGSIFSQLSQKHIVFKQKQYDLLNYMNQKNIKTETQTKVMKYLEYLEEESDQCIPKGEAVLSQFPLELREQILREYFVKILKDVSIINDNFSIAFLNAISLKMKEKRLGPGEKILVKNTSLSILQFITKGSIEYSIEDGEYQRRICSIESDKSVIDFRQFVTGLKSTVSIQCTTMTNVAYITYSDFIEEIKKFHKDYEKFCFLRDQFLNDQRFERLCCSCNHYGHEIENCPQLHYSVNRPIYSQKVFYSQTQQRQANQYQRHLDKRVSWRNIFHEAKNDLKFIRWAYIVEFMDCYTQINIEQQMKIIESDKAFFKRCPKLKPEFIKKQNGLFTTRNGLDVIIEEESVNSMTNSDEDSNFQTDYSDTQFQKNKGFMLSQQDEDVMESLHTEQGGGLIQNINIVTDKFNNPENISLSNIMQDGDIKLINDSPRNNQGTIRNKSEVSIKRQESLNQNQRQNQKRPTFTPSVQQSNVRSNVRKQTGEIMDLDKLRSQTRHLTNRSLHQMITNQQMTEKQSTMQQSYISYQLDKQYSTSSMTNSTPQYNQQITHQQTRNASPNNQQDSIRQLDQLVEKFKRQCMKMMTQTLKVDYLSHQQQTTTNREDTQSKILTLSRNSKMTHRNNTINSVTNTQQIKSNLTLKSLQEDNNPVKKNKTEVNKMKTLNQQNFQRYQTLLNPSLHIFGPLQFKFDKMREYQIYYPKGNASNIIKGYKKAQQLKSSFTRQQMYKNRQSGISDQLLSGGFIDKHGSQFQKKVALKMSRMSYLSQADVSKSQNPI